MPRNVQPVSDPNDIRAAVHDNLPDHFVDYYLDAPAPDPITGKPMPQVVNSDESSLSSSSNDIIQPAGKPIISVVEDESIQTTRLLGLKGKIASLVSRFRRY